MIIITIESFRVYNQINILQCFNGPVNALNRFTIKVYEINQENAIGHLRREISRVTKFLIDGGANVSVELSSSNYRRSPFVQGGFEIPCKVTASLNDTCINLLIMKKYRQLVEDLHIEQAAEEIVASFLDPFEKDHSISATSKSTKKKQNTKEKDCFMCTSEKHSNFF